MNELRTRDPILFWAGALNLLGLLIATLLSISDTRLLLGINPWIKPMKFFTSITFFLWTTAWFMAETRDLPRARAIVRWTIAVAMAIEMILITTQTVRGVPSHFNESTAINIIIFSIMGLTIAVSTVAMGLFLSILRRDTPPRRAGYLWGMRLGVALFLLASIEGGVIIANGAHTVSQPDGGPGLPFVNWSTTGGDLRIAHFFGMHAMQALPLFGFLLDRTVGGDRAVGGDKPSGLSIPATVVIATAMVWLPTPLPPPGFAVSRVGAAAVLFV